MNTQYNDLVVIVVVVIIIIIIIIIIITLKITQTPYNMASESFLKPS